jgi:hypothetical protein
VGSSGCGAGAVPSKQTKQTSKGLVFDAVRVWWCGGGGGAKQRLGAVAGSVRVQGCGSIQAKIRWLGLVLC